MESRLTWLFPGIADVFPAQEPLFDGSDFLAPLQHRNAPFGLRSGVAAAPLRKEPWAKRRLFASKTVPRPSAAIFLVKNLEM